MTEPQQQSSSSFSSALQSKMGPFPVWAWLAAGVGGILIVSYLRNRQSTSASTSSSTTSDAQIPQFVNQTYTTVTPPEASVPVTNQVATPKAGLHDPRAVSQYFLVHDTKNNKWYYVNFAERSAFTLTPQAAQGNLKYKPTVVNTTQVPTFKGGQLRFV